MSGQARQSKASQIWEPGRAHSGPRASDRFRSRPDLMQLPQLLAGWLNPDLGQCYVGGRSGLT
ncbi:hypothetical protein ElyMa_002818600, partial [Elysia marginata]